MTSQLLLVFLDSNVVFSASRSASSPFLRFWELEHIEILTSPHSLGEIRSHYESVHHEKTSERLIRSMRIVSDRPDLALPDGIILPPKDAPIYLAAMGAGADYLITGDKKHFGLYFNQNLRGLTILEPMPFLRSQAI